MKRLFQNAKSIAALVTMLLATAVFSQVTGNVPRAAPVTGINGTAPVVVTPSGTVFDITLQPCAVGQVLQWAATPAPAGYKCTTLANSVIDLYRDGGKANHVMTGGGTVTLSATNHLSWTQRFIILGGGRGTINLSTAGYYDINMPPAGTVITGICGSANVTVTAAGVPLDVPTYRWSALWYQLPAGAQTSVPGNYKIATYGADCVIPNDYVLIAALNYDNQSARLGTGQIVKTGQTSQSAGGDFFRSDNYNGVALPNGAADNAKNVFLDANLALKSMLSFRPLNDGRNTPDGITWYTPAPANYGLYRTTGAWASPFQQLKMAFDTGIELQPSVAGSASPSYPKSYVNISAGGLRVERGNTGLGTLTPTTKLHIESAVANDSGLLLQRLNQSTSPAPAANTVAIGVDATGKVHVTNAVASIDSRSVNATPQQYNRPAIAYDFKQCASIGLTATQSGGTYCGLTTFRPYGFAADFSGGQVLQEAYSMDGALVGRRFERISTGAATWGAWRIMESGTRTPSYASVAAAVADATLTAGSVYMVVVGTDKTLKIK